MVFLNIENWELVAKIVPLFKGVKIVSPQGSIFGDVVVSGWSQKTPADRPLSLDDPRKLTAFGGNNFHPFEKGYNACGAYEYGREKEFSHIASPIPDRNSQFSTLISQLILQVFFQKSAFCRCLFTFLQWRMFTTAFYFLNKNLNAPKLFF